MQLSHQSKPIPAPDARFFERHIRGQGLTDMIRAQKKLIAIREYLSVVFQFTNVIAYLTDK